MMFKLNFFFTIIYITWVIVPYVYRNTSTKLVILILFFWVITYVFSQKKRNIIFDKIYLWLFFLISFLIIQYLRVIEITAFGNLLSAILFYFPIFIYLNLKKFGNERIKYMKAIFYWITLLVFFNAMSNIYLLIGDPTLIKNMTGTVDVIVASYSNSNLATLSQVAFSSFLLPIFFYFIFKGSNFQKIYFALLTIATLTFTYLAGSMITSLTVIFGILVYGFLSVKKIHTKFLVLSFGSTILLIFFIEMKNIAMLLYQLSIKVSSQFYAERIQEIVSFLLGSSDMGSLQLRLYDNILSLKSFLYNPIIGKGLIYSDQIEITGIGMHSQIIDDFGRHGIIGVFLIGVILINWIRNQWFPFHIKENKIVSTILLMIIFFALFNIFSNSIYGLIIFLIVPIFLEWRKKEYGNKI